MTRGEAEGRSEMAVATSGGSGRNPRGTEARASSVTARRDDSSPRDQELMEAVVERENMWSRVAADTAKDTSMCFMNRRIRNRTSGGVGGRRG